MDPQDVLNQVKDEFRRRKFSPGVAIAFIDILVKLEVPGDLGISDLASFLAKYPRREFVAPGKPANQLIVELPGGSTLGMRSFYNAIEGFFRAKNQRFDYPSCAPHATQSWRDYQAWLDAMCGFSEPELLSLRQNVCDFVLDALPSQAFDPSSLIREPPLFEAILDGFDLTKHPGEKTGAAYQGLVFGFLRADNPHLQVEIDKVRTGSKRLQRVGDVDGWEGARLAITAEVKQFILKDQHVEPLTAFAGEANARGAIGLVCSLGFEEGVRERMEDLGVRALDIDDLRDIVSLWDPMKQRTAVASMTYYVKHVEKNSALSDRLDAFLADALAAFEGKRATADDAGGDGA